jgi:hypothetical protein
VNAVYRRSANLMEADIGNELVALDPKGGSCFGFNEVATWVWRRLEKPASFDQLREELLADYDVTAEQCTEELAELLADMTAKGLVGAEPEAGNHST